jgi:uncharacterized membrane protein
MTDVSDGARVAPGPRLTRPAVRERLQRAGAARGRRDAALALLVYLAVTMVWLRGALVHMDSACACGLPGDPAQYAWAFEWFPHALFSGLPLLDSHAIWSPTGINLAGATATPFLAFILAPVTALWGPIVSLNVAMILAPVTTAWGGYWLCRYISKSSWAGLIGGGTFGFSSYEIAQSSGHLHLTMAFCVPLAALSVLRCVDGAISRRRAGFELTLILLVQFYISTEVFFTSVVLGIAAMILAWVLADRAQRRRVVGAGIAVGSALAVTLLISIWYVHAELNAPEYAKDLGFLFYSTDVLSLLVPMSYTWIGGHTFSQVSALFQAGPGETNLYIGLPMALIVLRYLCTRWRLRGTKLITALLCLSVLWVLGTHLYVAGRPTIWLPYSIVARLPGFNQIMQGRVAVYVALLCAVVLSLWLASPSRRPALRWACGLVALAFVLPNILYPGAGNKGEWLNPTFFKTSMYKRYLKQNETILPIAWAATGESLMWQAEDHMYYNMASGYFMEAPPVGWRNQLTADLWADTPRLSDASLLRPFVHERHVSDIVVQDSELHAWSPVLRAAGLRAAVQLGGVTLYRVPATWLSA